MIRTLLLPAVPALFLAACGAPEAPAGDAPNTDVDQADGNARKVTTLTLETAPFDHYFTVQGNVETDRMARLFPMTRGPLSASASPKETVRKGQVLLDLDNDVIASNRDELDTRLGLALDLLARQERLWEQGIGTEVQLLEARANVEALEESIAAFNEQVDLGQVTAPFAGTVDRIFAKEGEMASPMQPVVRVLDLEEMYVRASVSDHYVGAVLEGHRVDIVVPGMDTLSSSIGRVGRYIEMANRTFEIVVPIAGDHGLPPNQFVSLRINDLHVDTAPTLPSSLILQDRAGKDFVYRIENGQAKRQPVTIGTAFKDRVLILGGLTAGATIIDRGAGQVVEGEAVQVIR